ncbi:MAG: lytic transglycosylase domain-containing protein [Candidatus Thiothrix sulfatifontis]|nr:MAG: lytic transglycosylase domain-containing protein [Candidatus Thiothrix sulfatifontis]
MKLEQFFAHLVVCIILLGVSTSSLAGSCDQQHVNVLRQKAQIYDEAITNSAMRYRINPALITAVITAESCFRNDAQSHKGAGGLMQLIPATAKRFGVNDRFNPAENIDGGTRYLRWLLNRYNGSIPHAIAAYNAGEGRVDRYGANVPIAETAVYTRRVLNAYGKLASNGKRPQARVVQPQVIRASYIVKPQPKPEQRFKWDEFSD